MRTTIKKSTLAAAVMAVSLLGNGAVLADGGRYYHDRQNYGHHQHDKKRQYKALRYGGHHQRGYHDKRHHGRHVTNYYEYDDDNDAEKLLIGLAIGGLIGYAINRADYQ